jgi:hypothetical protein
MAFKGPLYEEKDFIANGDTAMLDQLKNAVAELETRMRTSKPISGYRIKPGLFGVDKAQRGIAADSVISIARAIKALKGW